MGVEIFQGLPRTQRRKTAPVSAKASQKALLDVSTKRLPLFRAVKMHNVSRLTFDRRKNGKHKFHKIYIFSLALENILCFRLIPVFRTMSGLSNVDLRRNSYEIRCSSLKRGVIGKLPAFWHLRKSAGCEWWLNFKKNLHIDVKKNQGKDSGASIKKSIVCQKIHEKGAKDFRNVAAFAGKFQHACESCFLDRRLVQ